MAHTISLLPFPPSLTLSSHPPVEGRRKQPDRQTNNQTDEQPYKNSDERFCALDSLNIEERETFIMLLSKVADRIPGKGSQLSEVK